MRKANLSQHLYGLFIFTCVISLFPVFPLAANAASLADLAGTWNLNEITTGPDAPWWQRATITVQPNGKFIGTNFESDWPNTPVSGSFSLVSGGFTIAGPAINGKTILCQMDLGKTVFACTSTKHNGGSTNLMIGTKQAAPGSYSNTDLVATDWEANMLDGGPSNPAWMRISGDAIDINGISQGSYSDSNGDTATLSGQVALSANGEVTCVSGCPDANWISFMDASKSVIVGTYGVSATTPDAVLTVSTKMAPSGSYSMADLVGVWQFNILASGSGAPFWDRGTFTIKQDGTSTITSNQSDGKKETAAGPTFSISSDGLITTSKGGSGNGKMVMNAGKTVMVETDTWSGNTDPGTTELMVQTKSEGLPGTPTIGTVTPENAEVKVSFTPPALDGGSAITSYTVTPYIGTTAGKTTTGSGAGNQITVPGLTNGTQYTFTVAATNKFGTGPASGSSNPVTPATKPSAPTITTVTAGNGVATVTFSEGSDGGGPITGYSVNSNPKGGVDYNLNSTSLSHQVTSLTNGTKYTFTVSATNAVGTSTSKPSKPIIPATVPGAPTNVTATAGKTKGTVKVTFKAPANGGSAITGYTVTSPTDSTVSVTGKSTSITVTGLTSDTSYTFTVYATNAIGPREFRYIQLRDGSLS